MCFTESAIGQFGLVIDISVYIVIYLFICIYVPSILIFLRDEFVLRFLVQQHLNHTSMALLGISMALQYNQDQ